jgi:tetratricopeptide (TPR) repeat protein
MFYKAIFKGNFQFGTPRSFEKAVETYTRKVENLYKGDVLVTQEQMFDEETLSLNLAFFVVQGTEKAIKNTAYLLETLSNFAFSGQGWCWMVNEGKVLFSMHFYPASDKTPVLSFMEGFQLAKQPGKEVEAIAKFDEAITRFPNHWTALERRGYIYMLLKDYDKAIESFQASIAIYPEQADAHSGLARVYVQQGKLQKAIGILDKAIKHSVPHQPVFWQSRRIKGECLVHLGKYDEAHFELKVCVGREFLPSNSNYVWRKSAMLYFSRVLSEQQLHKEAMEMFVRAIKTEDALDPIFEGKQLNFYNTMLENSTKAPKPSAKKSAAAKKKVATA